MEDLFHLFIKCKNTYVDLNTYNLVPVSLTYSKFENV
jgi:hypothetical protein